MPRFWAIVPALLLSVLALPVAAQTTLSGVVTNDGGGALSNMTVAAYNVDGRVFSQTTTTAGRYLLDLPAGMYHVLAYDGQGNYATGFNADASSFEESPATVLTSGQSAVVNLVLHLGGRVSGDVTASGTFSGIVVAAYNLSGTRRGFTAVDSQGAYSLVLPPGAYKLAAYDVAGVFAPIFFSQQLTFASADSVTVAAQQTRLNINFDLQIGARALGSVSNTTGAPIANAVVLAYNAAGVQIAFAITPADGTFAMTLPPGTYRFVAVDPSFVYAAGFLNDADSFDLSPPVVLSGGQARTDLAFRLERGGTVTGTAIDATTGTGIRNITVAAYNTDGTQRTFVTTDASGKYVLLLPPGEFRIAAFDTALTYATQFYPQSTSFARASTVSPTVGQPLTLQPFTLETGGHLHGIVSDGVSPVAGAVVSAYDIAGELITSATTAQNGSYRMVVPAGSYRLISYDPLLRYAPANQGGAITFAAITPVTVTVNTDPPVPFTLHRGTLLNGTVVDHTHAPVSDLVITALDLNANAIANAISGTDGTFRFALVPGQYKFLAYDPNGRYPTVYMGGSSFATAATVTVGATGAPVITVTVPAPPKRRAVHH